MNIENARILVHFSILQANLIGAPKGKALAGRNIPDENPPSNSSVTLAATGQGNPPTVLTQGDTASACSSLCTATMSAGGNIQGWCV